MAKQLVTVVRIYIREGEHVRARLLTYLQDEAKVAGATVFRGIAGFGPDGKSHTTSLLDLSLDLPEVVEFFDSPDRVETILSRIEAEMALRHVISWTATMHGPAERPEG